MKTFIVKIEYMGLGGSYVTERIIVAKTAKSAENLARRAIGNRDVISVNVREG